MSRKLDDLSSDLRPLAFELLARLAEAGIPVLVVDTLRTETEHRANLASGASKTALSKHLPRRLRGWAADDPEAEKSDAIDVCPYEQFMLRGVNKLQWDAKDPAWAVIGQVAESLGLRWGGRWRNPHDPGHCELKN